MSSRIMCQYQISTPATNFGLDDDDIIHNSRVERPSQALFGVHEIHISESMRGDDIRSLVFFKMQNILR